MKRTFLLAVSLTALGATALAKPARPPVDLTKLAAVSEPIAKAPSAERGQRTCAALADLTAAAPPKDAPQPKESSVDKKTWTDLCEELGLTLKALGKECPAKDASAIDKDSSHVGDLVGSLRSASVARDMPPAMKQFDAALRKLWPSKRKTDCKQIDVLLTVVDSLAKPPAGVDAAKWTDRATGLPDFLKQAQSYCTPHADDEGSDFAAGYDQVHGRFYDLVLLLPARK